MASVDFRAPYSPVELEKLYPATLRLQHVQIIMRHGERTPVTPRFQNTGLAPYWPYCQVARRFRETVLANSKGQDWESLEYKRHIETIGPNDAPKLARAADGQIEGIWYAD